MKPSIPFRRDAPKHRMFAGLLKLHVPPAGYVSMTRSERILQLWTALRDRGVELKPLDGHRLKGVWHRRLKDAKTSAKH